ncbi:MAG: heparinase II/III family protein [Pseudomonadota bacterium]
MADNVSWSTRKERFLNRTHARTARWTGSATAFTTTPEPRTIGSFARGRQINGGNFLFAGYLVQDPGTAIWDLPMPDESFEVELHGFTWLDDLAAVGDMHAARHAQDWTHGWVQRFSNGQGPGWTPDLTGRRLIRWINHSILLLNGKDADVSTAYFKSLSQQTVFLARRWKAASPGLPRFEALTGLIYAGLALEGMDKHVSVATHALARECKAEIDADGGLVTRSPEELLDVFTLLNWAADAVRDAGGVPDEAITKSIAAMAPVLRALRHSDGGLARFHGGGKGMEGRLDRALATAAIRGMASHDRCMGYARISHGRTSLIVDAAPPPERAASANAHASTLAMEITSGRRPLIVNCGSGATFGRSWRRAGRATPSHSTLGIEGYSSSRLGGAGQLKDNEAELLIETPQEVGFERMEVEGGTRIVVGHDGYVATHGLTHVRTLHVGFDGRAIQGEDVLLARSEVDKRKFDLMFDKSRLKGVPFSIRFHLHPHVDATLDMNATAVSMALKSGELWVFQMQGPVDMEVESSVYLEKSRLSPRATKQVVLSGYAVEYATRVSWSLAKTQDTPNAIRDYDVEDTAMLVAD